MLNNSSKTAIEALSAENALLRKQVEELQKTLNDVANTSGFCIIKQLPDGVIELNGEPIDKNATVEYYNSSQATYGELTMYRVAKEAFARNEKKLVNMHLEECDKYKDQIYHLTMTINELNDSINKHCEHEDKQNLEIVELNTLLKDISDKNTKQFEEYNTEKALIISKYKGMIEALEEDIETWKKRYLELNNIKPDGTIVTKYGEIIQD